MTEALKIAVVVADESKVDIENALREAEATNVKEQKERGFTGVEIVFVGLLVGTQLANLTLKLSRLWKSGLVIDARGARIRTEKNPDLPRGTVLVIAPDGTESKLHEPSEVDISALISALTGK